MIQLTEKVIAVEVPNDATAIELNEGVFLVFLSYKIGIESYLKYLELKPNNHSLIGVTPLSEEQWKEVVENKPFDTVSDIGFMEVVIYKDYQYDCFDLSTATESGLSLLESKGLDINKKYAIIKIEK